MHIPYRLIQGFFILLLFGLVALGTNPTIAGTLSLSEAAEQKAIEKRNGMFGRLKDRIVQTWSEGDVNLFVPAYTWHNRFTYDRERVRNYNEHPWGAGLGLSIVDEGGDSHLLFLMAFQDSWSEIQPYGGYGYFKNWYFDSNNDLRIGVGISLGITAREQYSYIPFPLPAPIFGIGYKQFSVEAAYIPGLRNNMNFFFTWLRWTFS